jgi:hypothetical protein
MTRRAARRGSLAQMLAAFRIARSTLFVAVGYFRMYALLPASMQQ